MQEHQQFFNFLRGNKITIYLIVLIFCTILYFFLDLSLFPMAFYSPAGDKTSYLLVTFVLAVFWRTTLSTLLYRVITGVVSRTTVFVSLTLNGIPLQFTEGLLIYLADGAGYYDFTGLNPEFLQCTLLNRVVITAINWLSIQVSMAALPISVVIIASILELPRFLLGIGLIRRLS